MRRAVIFGGTGVLGRAVARRLAAAGWTVELTGRDESRMPPDLADAGVVFHGVDRLDQAATAELIGPGADLLVDALCFTRNDARTLLPYLGDIQSTVMLSSKAVYVDERGHHVNSDIPPHFDRAITEDQPTMEPRDIPFNSREGYGANKVAAEQMLLDSGFPVTVVRASKVHGEGAARPREWVFVKRVIDTRSTLLLARGGRGVDHTTAAVNTAALIERVSEAPGARVLNSADPDAPSARSIARIVSDYLQHEWREVLLDDDAEDGLGMTPWDADTPIVLDTHASLDLGYVPVGDYAATVPLELDWLMSAVKQGTAPAPADLFFADFLDYAREDRFTMRSSLQASSL